MSAKRTGGVAVWLVAAAALAWSGNSAVAVLSGSLAPDLARVILAWPALPEESKAAVLALVAAHDAAHAGRVRQ